MKTLVMKIYRRECPDPSTDLAGIARQAADLYGAQRYQDTPRDAVVRPKPAGDWLFDEVLLEDDITVYEFHNSAIVVLEQIRELDVTAAESAQFAAESQVEEQQRLFDRVCEARYPAARPLWAAQWIVLQPGERRAAAPCIRTWLRDSIRPEDADRIIAGDLDVSMTWLRYVAMDHPGFAAARDAMRLAQYYYAEFDQITSDLLNLAVNLGEGRGRASVRQLSRRKIAHEMQGVRLEEALKSLPRPCKRQVEQVLGDWDFPRMRKQVDDLQRICTEMIEARVERKSSFSRVATEVILVAIGLLAFLELTVSWSVVSRQFATDPTLLLEEPVVPWAARVVATTPLDYVLLASLVIVVLVIAIFGLIKAWSR